MRAGLLAVAAGLTVATTVWAQPLVKVRLDVVRSAQHSRDAVQGSGRVVITERGRARPNARVDTDSRETRTRQSTGIFTIVQSGGEASLTVATQVPYSEVAFFQDYATGAGYVATGVVFKDVGTSLKVGAVVLPGNQIRVRLTPVISYLAADGSGRIELTQAAIDLTVRNGQPLVIGAASTRLDTVTRRIFGLSEASESSDTTLTLTATVE